MTSRPIPNAKRAKIPIKMAERIVRESKAAVCMQAWYPSFECACEKGCETRQGKSRKGKGSALVFLVIWGGTVGQYRRNILESISGTRAPTVSSIKELFYEQVVGKSDMFLVFQTSSLGIQDAMYVHTVIFSAENFRAWV